MSVIKSSELPLENQPSSDAGLVGVNDLNGIPQTRLFPISSVGLTAGQAAGLALALAGGNDSVAAGIFFVDTLPPSEIASQNVLYVIRSNGQFYSFNGVGFDLELQLFASGQQGTRIFQTSGIPALDAFTEVVGDYALDEGTGILYRREASEWVTTVNLTGPEGRGAFLRITEAYSSSFSPVSVTVDDTRGVYPGATLSTQISLTETLVLDVLSVTYNNGDNTGTIEVAVNQEFSDIGAGSPVANGTEFAIGGASGTARSSVKRFELQTTDPATVTDTALLYVTDTGAIRIKMPNGQIREVTTAVV